MMKVYDKGDYDSDKVGENDNDQEGVIQMKLSGE